MVQFSNALNSPTSLSRFDEIMELETTELYDMVCKNKLIFFIGFTRKILIPPYP